MAGLAGRHQIGMEIITQIVMLIIMEIILEISRANQQDDRQETY